MNKKKKMKARRPEGATDGVLERGCKKEASLPSQIGLVATRQGRPPSTARRRRIDASAAASPTPAAASLTSPSRVSVWSPADLVDVEEEPQPRAAASHAVCVCVCPQHGLEPPKRLIGGLRLNLGGLRCINS